MSSTPLFSDRLDAGEQLAQLLCNLVAQLKEGEGLWTPPIVYALPRGGIPLAVPVARQLGCPLDIVVAKKITLPRNRELAIGAVTSERQVLWTRAGRLGKKNNLLRQAALRKAQAKAQEQLTRLAPGRPLVNPQGALALLIDDGIATGMTMAAAAKALKERKPAQIWICAPVAPAGLINWLDRWCDRVVVLEKPQLFFSVSRFYATFPQVPTEEALTALQTANQNNYYLPKQVKDSQTPEAFEG
ncbi:phosphoribosyltransferase family protein [Lyngbya aestuarii]|uniref:phosphoribosyltransferase family protein n=1 Tax=Lyngbya aestuarii TaxID=118322 RepID=UPI00403DB20B